MPTSKKNPDWMGEWVSAQKEYWENIALMVQKKKKRAYHPFHDHLDSWSKLSQHCQHFASMTALYPRSAFQSGDLGMPSYAEAFASGLFQHVGSLPAIGPLRESIELLQQNEPLWADVIQAWTTFQGVCSALWFKVCQQTMTEIFDRMQQEQSLTTRQLYDIWIECGEEAYADVVKTDEYQKIYGKFANAVMAYKNHHQAIFEKMLRNMDLPTKQDLNGAYAHIHALMREVRELKKAIKSKE